MLLSEARTRTRRYAQDERAVLFDGSNTPIDDALTSAQAEVWQMVVNTGWTNCVKELSVTASSGVVDLSATKPLKILNVYETSGQARWVVRPVRYQEAMTTYTGNPILQIQYIPRVTLPAADGDPFVWGDASLDLPLLDDLMCLIAASSIRINEGESSKALRERKAELTLAAMTSLNIPSYRILPLTNRGGRRNSRLFFQMAGPYSMQLVF